MTERLTPSHIENSRDKLYNICILKITRKKAVDATVYHNILGTSFNPLLNKLIIMKLIKHNKLK